MAIEHWPLHEVAVRWSELEAEARRMARERLSRGLASVQVHAPLGSDGSLIQAHEGVVPVFLSPFLADAWCHARVRHAVKPWTGTAADLVEELAARGLSLVLNPCAACGHEAVAVAASAQEVRAEIENTLAREITTAMARLEAATRELEAGEPRSALPRLLEIVQHIDPGMPEAHFQIGVCGALLGDPELVEEARRSLQALGGDWLGRLDQVVGGKGG
jgi:hypothetical protein